MPARLSAEEYNRRCVSLGLPTPIIPYKNARTKLEFKCKECGEVQLLTPDYHIDTYEKIDSYMCTNVEPLIERKI